MTAPSTTATTTKGLFTRVDGAGELPWLVLSHSLASDHTMWDGEMPALTKAFRVLRFDTRGHGASVAPLGAYGFNDLADDVIAVMDHHGVATASFMGLSLGGMTGLGLALAHPERVERLVCCAARADAPDTYRQGWDERLALVNTQGTGGLVEGTLQRWLTAPFRDAHPEAVAKVAAGIRATSDQGYKSCVAALKSLDYLKDLGGLRVPTLYVAGAEDVSVPVAVVEEMATLTPGARLAVVPDAAHLININQPGGFAAALAGFLT